MAAPLGTDNGLPALPVGVALGVLVCYAVSLGGLSLGVPVGRSGQR